MTIDTKKFYPNKYSMCLYQSYGILKDSGQYSTLAPVSNKLIVNNLLFYAWTDNLVLCPVH